MIIVTMSMSITVAAILFFLTALLYSAVGFGGGSTYTALLVLLDTNFLLIPLLSLSCNIIVVVGNVAFAWRHGLLHLNKISPLIAASVPMAFIGGALPVPEMVFISLLTMMLFAAGVHMLIAKQPDHDGLDHPRHLSSLFQIGSIGGILGLVSGIVGIGGGILLAPVLHLAKWDKPKNIAALCSLFILVNSVAGLAGQLTKLQPENIQDIYFAYWPLLLSVVLGGFIGRRLSFGVYSESTVRKLTAFLILFVALRLSFSLITV